MRSGHAAIVLLAAGLLAGAAPEAPAEAGRFEGSWARSTPGEQQALLIRRSEAGAWQIRLIWRREGLDVDTGWEGRAEYLFRRFPGTLEIEIDPAASDARRIVARYRREQSGPRAKQLVEEGRLELYRTGRFGRTLVWSVDPLTRRITVGEPLSPDEADSGPIADRLVWRFQKQAERLLEWDEFYW